MNNTLTTEQIAELRRLMDRVDCRNVLRPTQDEWNEFALACRLALPAEDRASLGSLGRRLRLV